MIAIYATSIVGLMLVLVFVIWHMEKEIRLERREFMRTIEKQNDRIMHMSGKTWNDPPVNSEPQEVLELNYDMFPDADDN